MSRVSVVFKKDSPCVVRMTVSHTPNESLTPAGARALAAELLLVADQCDRENAELERKAK